MAVVLEGGCRVTGLREGAPTITGTLRSWAQVGRAVGAAAISLRRFYGRKNDDNRR